MSEKTRSQGRPRKSEEEKLRGYRYNLDLDRDLKEYLHEAAWKKRTSITQYINDLIRADMENEAELLKENIKKGMDKIKDILIEHEFAEYLTKYKIQMTEGEIEQFIKLFKERKRG